jgi:hypothetical protein
VVILFVLALVPRTLAPGDFWTADEAKHWSVRVETFLPAVEEGNYAATNLVGHPGVTTMWLGSLGTFAQQRMADMGWIPADDPFLQRYFLRLPVGIITALVIALAYPMLRRLFNQRIALLTSFLWITDPFIVAHSKVLHVDALLTSFILLSLLAALLAFRLEQTPATPLPPRSPVRWSMLAASALAAALALLTKSPSMILFPMVGLIGLTGFIPYLRSKQINGTQQTGQPIALGNQLGSLTLAMIVWAIIAAVAWVALWPAAWLDPLGSAWTVIYEIFRNGAEPHGWGNFFLGRPVPDPGPLFYPVGVIMRLTPWTLAGIGLAGVAAGVALWQSRRKQPALSNETHHEGTPTLPLIGSPPLLLLIIFVFVFGAILTTMPKKFDRYMLPAFPMLDIVAAIGLLWFADTIQQRLPRPSLRPFVLPSYWTLIVVGLCINLAWFHPYELAYFNQVLGGGPVAQRTVFVGWGEGLEKAGEYIKQQENGCDLGVASWYEFVILPYTCSPVLHQGYITVPGHVHYAVLYINQVQRQIKMEEIGPSIAERGALVHTVRIHGIDYAYVYQLRQPRQYPTTADFGDEMRLTGYDVDVSDVRSSGVLTLTLQWHTQQPMDNTYMMFVHVFDEQGQQVGQTDVPPGGHLPTNTWGHNRFIDWVHRVPVDPQVNGERLWVVLGVYDPATFTRLPLTIADDHDSLLSSLPPGAPDDGANALVLVPVSLSGD